MLYRLLAILFIMTSALFGCTYQCDVYYNDGTWTTTWDGVSTDEADAENDCEDFWGEAYYCRSCDLGL